MILKSLVARTAACVAVVCAGLIGVSDMATATSSAPVSASAPVKATAPVTVAAPAGSWTAGGLIASKAPAPMTQAAPTSGFAQVGGCTFYASSSYAGGWCASGGLSGVPQSLAAWLAGRTFYPCRFFGIPDGMVINAPAPDGGRWMLKACFSGYDLSEEWGGNNIRVEIAAQWVRDGVRPETEPYMEQFWDVIEDQHFYPLPRINYGPSTPFTVGTYSYFWASWVEALTSSEDTEPEYRVAYQTNTQGTVYLHAWVTNVTILPGDGLDPVNCGVADVEFDDEARDPIPRSEGGDQESECWAMYEHSTADEELLTTQMRAQATWRVQVEDAAGNSLARLGDFSYTVRQRVAVAEVQTLALLDEDE